jgi:hypothetical protein
MCSATALSSVLRVRILRVTVRYTVVPHMVFTLHLSNAVKYSVVRSSFNMAGCCPMQYQDRALCSKSICNTGNQLV